MFGDLIETDNKLIFIYLFIIHPWHSLLTSESNTDAYDGNWERNP